MRSGGKSQLQSRCWQDLCAVGVILSLLPFGLTCLDFKLAPSALDPSVSLALYRIRNELIQTERICYNVFPSFKKRSHTHFKMNLLLWFNQTLINVGSSAYSAVGKLNRFKDVMRSSLFKRQTKRWGNEKQKKKAR